MVFLKIRQYVEGTVNSMEQNTRVYCTVKLMSKNSISEYKHDQMEKWRNNIQEE
jgi:hypothetical protein